MAITIGLPDNKFHFKGSGTGSAADLATKNVYVQLIVCSNPDTGGALTFDLADKASTPWELYNDQSVADNTAFVQAFDPPILFSNGITLTAPATMDVQIIGLTERT